MKPKAKKATKKVAAKKPAPKKPAPKKPAAKNPAAKKPVAKKAVKKAAAKKPAKKAQAAQKPSKRVPPHVARRPPVIVRTVPVEPPEIDTAKAVAFAMSIAEEMKRSAARADEERVARESAETVRGGEMAADEHGGELRVNS
ncbi:MAG: hypothetical protein IJ829_03895 [Kiritimatiellae bacterium]|nr:hypothetical protein [Kiritimatiellia bacterium]